MNDLIVTLRPYLEQYGHWMVFAGILLEDFGMPMPGEAMLIAGSILASQGDMRIIPLLSIAWAGAVIGDNIGYGIGRFGGRLLVLRYGHYVLINEKHLGRAEAFFERHGGIVVTVARFLQILRQLNGIVAGIARMPWWRFLIYNAIGAALWVSFWGMLFYHLGSRASQLRTVFKTFERFLIAGFIIAILAVMIYLVLRHRK